MFISLLDNADWRNIGEKTATKRINRFPVNKVITGNSRTFLMHSNQEVLSRLYQI